MAKTYSITVRITEEQKKFIDKKIAEIKDKVDIEVPAGIIIRKMLDRALYMHEARDTMHELGHMAGIRHLLAKRFGEHYGRREHKIEDLLELIEEYNELDDETGDKT